VLIVEAALCLEPKRPAARVRSSTASPAPRWRWSVCPAARRCCSWMCRATAATPCCSTAISTSSRDERLVGGAGSLAAGAQGRQALRPRRRRRRLCNIACCPSRRHDPARGAPGGQPI